MGDLHVSTVVDSVPSIAGILCSNAWHNPRMTETGSALQSAIEKTGYYPALVIDALDTALAGEELVSYLVQHETTFDRDQLHRHMTVLALTPTRLIVSHTDEHAPDETSPVPYATASTEAVRLQKVDSVVVTRIVSSPEQHVKGGPLRELMLTIGWGAVSRIDLEPATCGDPSCEADHGYSGTSSNDDLTVRISEAADGLDVMVRAAAFAEALSEVTAARLR